jgi:cell division protein FtsX
MMEKSNARAAGTAEAERTSTFGWAVFGFLIPVVAVLVVHLRSPKVPAAVLARASDDPAIARVFEAQYVETLKSKQVTNTWLGAAVGLFFVLAAVILF